ncbi:MAG: tetratricopeptide repeat protein [Actinomycetota bacterium]
MIFDDIHWGEPTFLDLIEHVADWARDAPLLLLCIARPELLDKRPGWSGGKLNATSILLEPLGDDEVSEMLVHLLGEIDLADDVKQRITAGAEGNPLFVEQMLAMLLEENKIQRSNGSWVASGDISTVTVPPTVHALLASRLDSLRYEERQVIERASVVGQVFYRGAVVQLSPGPQQPAVPTTLMSLVRKELIRPERAEFPGEDGFRFRHILIRDVAYDALPKQERAALHERFADWLESTVGVRVAEYEEIVGYHLEQAYAYGRDLGHGPESLRTLGDRASERLAKAAHRAFTRGDIGSARKLLERAIELTGDRTSTIRLQLELAEAEESAGDFALARARLRDVGDLSGEHISIRGRRAVLESVYDLATDPEGQVDTHERLLRNLIPRLESVGDHVSLARAYRAMANIANHGCHGSEMLRCSELAMEHAHAAGDVWEEAETIPYLVTALGLGPVPHGEAVERLRHLLVEVAGQPRLTATIGRALGSNMAYAGEVEEGKALNRRSRAAIKEMGMVWLWALTAHSEAGLYFADGELERAESVLREGYEVLAGMGEASFLSTTLTTLGHVLCREGRFDEAWEMATRGMELGASDDLSTQVEGRTVHGLILAHRGQLVEGERLVREATELGKDSDYNTIRAQSRVGLAEVLILAGRTDEARAVLEEALAMWRERGDVLSPHRAEELLASLG